MANYTTAQIVYDKVGVDDTVISAAQMQRILDLADAEVDRLISSTCIPVNKTEIRAGDGLNYLYIRNLPVMSVTALEIRDTTIDMENVKWRSLGSVTLLSTAQERYFYEDTTLRSTRISYIYGWLEESKTIRDTIQSDVTKGTGKTVAVVDGSQFAVDDWVLIVGFDGWEESAQITAISTNDLTITLIYDHEATSTITKLIIPPMVVQLAGTIGAIMGALYQMGATYTFATSYQTPDYQVSKGVPYPHFQKVLDASVQERDFIMTQLPRWPAFF